MKVTTLQYILRYFINKDETQNKSIAVVDHRGQKQ